MKKKICSFILTLIMCIGICSTNTMNVQAAVNGIRISKNSVVPGEKFQIELYIPPIAQKLASVEFNITFDNNAFMVENDGYIVPAFSNASQSSSSEEAANNNGKLTLTITGNEGENTIDFSNGVTITINFTVKENATVNTNYVFSISKYLIKSIDQTGNFVDQEPNVVKSTTIKVNPRPVNVTGITLSTTEKTLKAKGETFTLAAAIQPENADNKNVSFSSSNTAVAVVSSTGVVTAVGNGTAVITATTQDGNKTATCTVTVAIPHVHSMETIHAVASTCKVQGNHTYYHCTGCNQYFKDAAGTNKTTVDDEKLPVTSHKLTKHDAVGATHEKDGNIEYWECGVCNGIFKDSAGTQGITKTQTIIAKKGHNYSNTYRIDDANHWLECSCGSIADKYAHIFQWKVDKAATEQQTGLQHEECVVCGYKRNENTVIDKLVHKHTIVKKEAKAATCTQKGNIEYYQCTSCEKIYKDAAGTIEIDLNSVIIAATGHVSTSLKYDTKYHWKVCDASECGIIIDGSKELHKDANKDKVCDICGGELSEISSEIEEKTTEENSEEETWKEQTESVEREETSEEKTESNEREEIEIQDMTNSLNENQPTNTNSKNNDFQILLIIAIVSGAGAMLIVIYYIWRRFYK